LRESLHNKGLNDLQSISVSIRLHTFACLNIFDKVRLRLCLLCKSAVHPRHCDTLSYHLSK